ncbi:MAG TPA: DUF3015 domain-containing protein [Gammaproteobacteria bacterium]|nr:DUF3015 domain-containing protein [Gammaproteobacteria bacterium]
MWKKSLLIAGLVALPMSGAMAKDSTGCGAGSMLFNGKQGPLYQVLAVTTNGILGNQTFGITSGTLGCDKDGVIRSSAKISKFIGNNMNRLAADMASGGGETLASLARLMGVSQADRPAFYHAAKAHFDSIYPSDKVTAGQVLKNLDAVMASNPRLARYTVA